MNYLPPKACPRCNKTYWPTSEDQNYCVKCEPIIFETVRKIRQKKDELKIEKELDLQYLDNIREHGL